VGQTGQPYAGFGDDPLNASDPTGQGINISGCDDPGCGAHVTNNGVIGCDSNCGGLVSNCTTNCDSPGDITVSPGASCGTPQTPDCGEYPEYCVLLNQAKSSGNQTELECLDGAIVCTSSPSSQSAVSDYMCLATQGVGCASPLPAAPNVIYGTLCVSLILFEGCIGAGSSVYFSGGYGIGFPGVSVTTGAVTGASANQYLCKWSIASGGSFLVGEERGNNPGTTDAATGLQIGFGAGAFKTYGVGPDC
jgi:hypothetical protein